MLRFGPIITNDDDDDVEHYRYCVINKSSIINTLMVPITESISTASLTVNVSDDPPCDRKQRLLIFSL